MKATIHDLEVYAYSNNWWTRYVIKYNPNCTLELKYAVQSLDFLHDLPVVDFVTLYGDVW